MTLDVALRFALTNAVQMEVTWDSSRWNPKRLHEIYMFPSHYSGDDGSAAHVEMKLLSSE